MGGKYMDNKTLQARIRMVKALKSAITEANKLNKIVNDVHDMLEANAAKKAA